MLVSLCDIGTSKGVRIPAGILKELSSPQSFDLRLEGDKIVLNVVNNPRFGWAEKFKSSSNDLIIDDSLDIDELQTI
jgi:antitoxin component of MazEF toxin-antitoxin module